ncbi:cold shock domain-containing protein [Klebsiella variicola subsp. variicola]|nr:cold shock domain-containing protein [Klebsiella variicola subsp. variicola]
MLRQWFGFLKTDDSKSKLYFSRSELQKKSDYRVGDKVSYILGTNSKGPCACDIKPSVAPADLNLSREIDTATGQDYRAQAVIARDNRQFEQAEKLFRKAFEVSPSLQVVLSFAAMEKNRGRKKEAMDVYREGLKKISGKKNI